MTTPYGSLLQIPSVKPSDEESAQNAIIEFTYWFVGFQMNEV